MIQHADSLREMLGLVPWHWFLLFFTLAPASWSLSLDGLALLALSKNLKIPSFIRSTWNASEATPCQWHGVRCDDKGSVISLDLSSSDISGSIGPQIGLLKHLQVLSLLSNSISGSIPSELGNCSMLDELDLSGNLISGEIPASIANLKKLSSLSLHENSLNGTIPEDLFKNQFLESVYLHENQLSGSIPFSIGEATSIKYLSLDRNMLSGALPDSIGNCTKLEQLFLSDNQFSGSLPRTLSRIESLRVLDASNNSLTGEISFVFENCKMENFSLSINLIQGKIPPWLGNCSSLTILGLCCNRLSGQIPASLGLLRNLSRLVLSKNALSGPIPPEIANCRLLEGLELDENQLQGTVPKQLANLSKLQNLFLFNNRLTGEFHEEIWGIQSLKSVLIGNNSFTGKLPSVLAELKFLENITLSDNFFTGVIPQELGANSRLVEVDFSYNNFVGDIPQNICSGKALKMLVMESNLLNGSIPSSVADCPSLVRINLRNNKLGGHIPRFGNCENLSYIDLSQNSLSGDIPSSINRCMNITMIDWSENKLLGGIPPVIGKLVNLEKLILSHNSLQGPLPVQISSCSKLHFLDLSFNNLNGSALATLGNLKSLSQLRLQENRFSGGLPDSLSYLDKLIELQVGGNVLGGSIPSSLGRLRNLVIALNLSNNGLVGDIPPALGDFVGLESLDLSLNSLTGDLATLGTLKSLHALNVSHNQFTGPVPKNLLEFVNATPSPFDGNSGLCISCTGASDPLCREANHALEPCRTPRKRGVHGRLRIALIVLGPLLMAAVLVLSCICLKYRDRKLNSEESANTLFDGTPSKMKEVIQVTENFDDRYVIGSGAHGTVYRATMMSGEVYAVKKLAISAQKGSYKSMIRELKTLGKVRHRNLIMLKEFSLRGEYGFILYDFMENGSLHNVLHGIQPAPTVDWCVRYDIALGTAHGLAYLHNDCQPAIVHRDIKPSNILLDKDMVPHISDFGIAKLLDQPSTASQTTGIVGTIGYMAPELALSIRSGAESDVYSYGVVLLELLTRRKAADPSFPDGVDIVGWVSTGAEGGVESICDPELMDEVCGTAEMEEVRSVLSLALRCTVKEVSRRPSMADVVKELTDIRMPVAPCRAGEVGATRKEF